LVEATPQARSRSRSLRPRAFASFAAASLLLVGLHTGLRARLATPLEAGTEALGSSVSAMAQSVEIPYNGDFTFTRIRYGGGGGFGGFGRGGGSWAHDYPSADRNMGEILKEFTSMHPNTGGSNVVDLEDPEIFRSPILYLSEPGFWSITDEGARNLRAHLLKGGFIIFDDFDGPGHWENWAEMIARALPGARPIEIDQTHPIFDTFFFIEDIYVPHPMAGFKPDYYAIYEDNDPAKRMMALIVYNGDLAEYWEYAATGFFPVDPTSDSFRLGVNFFIYGLTR
jgi:hypothetical protein